MKVFILYYKYYDDSEIFGVFSSKEKAEDYRQEKSKLNDVNYWHISESRTEEYVLDQGTSPKET